MKNPNLIRVAGGTVAHGQFFQKPNIARDGGRAKNTDTVPTAFGQKRQTRAGGLHPWAHGQVLDDEPMAKSFHAGKSVAIHDGMGTSAKHAHERGIVAHVEDASKHLRAAGRLSARDKVKNIEEHFDETFIQHKVGKQSLPVSRRKLSE